MDLIIAFLLVSTQIISFIDVKALFCKRRELVGICPCKHFSQRPLELLAVNPVRHKQNVLSFHFVLQIMHDTNVHEFTPRGLVERSVI